MKVYEFDEFELRPASYELRHRGKTIALQPKVLDLLSCLIEKRGRVVTRHEILDALWPDVHVSESALAWCVSQARKALGQARGTQTPIETLHGRGYRFGAEVRMREGPDPTETDGAARPAPATQPAGTSLHESTTPVTPFVGREPIMSTLRMALERARRGHGGGGHLLIGEAGMGKTRCAAQLVTQARLASGSAWVGRCLDDEGAPAYWPWIQILRDGMREETPSTNQSEPAELLATLAPQRRDVDSVGPTGGLNGFWLVDRLVNFFVTSAQPAPRLIVIDDLQWADVASLRVLERIAPQLEQCAIVLLVTMRDAYPASDLATSRAWLRSQRHLKPLTLTGFDRAEIKEYLTQVTGAAPSADVVIAVQRVTGGNPLFVKELPLELIGQSGSADDARWIVSRTAHGLVRERLDGEGGRLRGVLEAASVLGESFELPVLMAMLQMTADELVELLDHAERVRLIVRLPGIGRYAFVHALARDALQVDLSARARSQLHLLAGEALEARAVHDERLGQLAFHFMQALPMGTHEKAAHYAELAARAAMGRFAPEEEHSRWMDALEALDFAPSPDPNTRCRLLIGLSGALLHLGRRAESRDYFKRAIRLARHHDNASLLLAAARTRHHSLLSHVTIDPLVREALESALPMLIDDDARVTALSRLAAVMPGDDGYEQSSERSRTALSLARPLGRKVLVEALWSRAFCLFGPDDSAELLDVADEMLRVDAASGRSFWSVEAYYAQLCAHLQRGNLAAAEDALEHLGSLCERWRWMETSWNHDRIVAHFAFARGDFSSAERSWHELAEHPVLGPLRYVKRLASVQRRALAIERDAPLADEAWDVSSRWNRQSLVRAQHCAWLVDQGRLDDARQHWAQLTAPILEALPRDRSYIACLATLARVAVALADRALASEVQALLSPYAAFTAWDVFFITAGSVALPLGLLADFLGNEPLASERFELALRHNHEQGLRPCLARTQVAYAKLLGKDPRTHARARELVAEAMATAQLLGMPRVLADARNIDVSLHWPAAVVHPS